MQGAVEPATFGRPLRILKYESVLSRLTSVAFAAVFIGTAVYALWSGSGSIVGNLLFLVFGLFFGLRSIYRALTDKCANWTIESGTIAIHEINPFRQQNWKLTPSDVQGFAVIDQQYAEAPTTWLVRLTTKAGTYFDTHELPSLAEAERMLGDIEAAFQPNGHAPRGSN